MIIAHLYDIELPKVGSVWIEPKSKQMIEIIGTNSKELVVSYKFLNLHISYGHPTVSIGLGALLSRYLPK